MKLLVIEDHPAVIEVIRAAFRSTDIIHSAHTLGEGLSRLEHELYDSVLLDLYLPDSPIERTVTRIREIRRRAPNTRLLVISGYPRPRGVEGADAFIPKGSNFVNELWAALRVPT